MHSLKQTGKLLRILDWRAKTEHTINQFYFDQKHIFLQELFYTKHIVIHWPLSALNRPVGLDTPLDLVHWMYSRVM
jgi:hypothetical protein